MQQPPRISRTEAANPTGLGQIKVIEQCWSAPIDISGRSPRHHLELALLPVSRNAKARFVDLWGPQRYEPMGHLFFLPAGQAINARSDCRLQRSIVCDFDPVAVERWFDEELHWTDDRLCAALDLTSPRLRQLLVAIGEEVRTPGFASETMIELMAAQAVIELSRHLAGVDAKQRSGGLAPWRLRLIEQRLVEQSAPPSLAELAQLCGLSVRQLSRAFRISRGRSLGDYIGEQRLNHAKRMLAEGMSIKAVAFNTGFSAPSNFTAAFVRATGETPTTYRARAGKEKPRRSGRGMH
jgi:AraC family transcriptional regulator